VVEWSADQAALAELAGLVDYVLGFSEGERGDLSEVETWAEFKERLELCRELRDQEAAHPRGREFSYRNYSTCFQA
jgi:hypothetical protein